MADARALLRAHRAENRIKHPHATYSDAGKLLCKLCHDVIKVESLWDTHIRSQSHRQRLQTLQPQPNPLNQGTDESLHKRKRSEDADGSASDPDDSSDTTRAKRSKTNTVASNVSTPNGLGDSTEGNREKTSPGLVRRTSGTPLHGVEIAIPSRPATPLASFNSPVSTPKGVSIGRSALIGSDAGSVSGVSTAAQLPISNGNTIIPSHSAVQMPSIDNNATTSEVPASGAVDEAEWAAFEAEMSALDAPAPPTGAQEIGSSGRPYTDTIISAPALTAAQVAAKSQEEENERRKQAADAEIADEREDATRALEEEFEDMEELESRVRRLKERREELRRGSATQARAAAPLKAAVTTVDGKENMRTVNGDDPAEDDEDDDDDEDDEWDGFRFRV